MLPRQVETIIKEKFADQRFIEREITENVVDKLVWYTKTLAYGIGIPASLIVLVLGILGLGSYSDFKRFINKSENDLQTQADVVQNNMKHLKETITTDQKNLDELPSFFEKVREAQRNIGDLNDDAGRLKRLKDQNKPLGVDLSFYTGYIDWLKAKNWGISFAYIKASEGTGFTDPHFQVNWQKSRAVSILRGAYTVFRPDQDPGQQAELFFQTVAAVKQGLGDLPPAVAVKDFPVTEKSSADLRILLQTINQKYARKPIIYTSLSFWKAYTSFGSFADYPLWVSQTNTSQPSTLPADWSRWTFWQFSQSGTVDGIPESVDINTFNGSKEQLVAYSRGAL